MECPSCSAPAADGAAECPACGLIFAKWRERREKEKREAAEALAALAVPSRPPNPWLGRAVAGALVAAWILGLCLYVLRHPAKRRPAFGADTGEFVEVRDPRTGEARRLPIRRMPGVPTGPTAAPPGPAPDPDSGR